MGTHDDFDGRAGETLAAHINVSALFERAERAEARAFEGDSVDDDLCEPKTVEYSRSQLPLPAGARTTLVGTAPAPMAKPLAPAPFPRAQLPLPAPELGPSQPRRRMPRGSVEPNVPVIAAPSSPTLFIAEDDVHAVYGETEAEQLARAPYSSLAATVFAILSAIATAAAFGLGVIMIMPTMLAHLASPVIAMVIGCGGAGVLSVAVVLICYPRLKLLAPVAGGLAAAVSTLVLPVVVISVLMPVAVVVAAVTFLVRELGLR
ncbi:MAG: hypothetical protein KJO07_05040 [Deltaproteobacteria bacterium]|nr:hypothetical protein [Deltaproteobacteria bacterium]